MVSTEPALAVACRQPRVAIVIVNWNGYRDTIECIDTVLAQDYANYALFVVDNGSGDSSIERIAEWCQQPLANNAWRQQHGVARLTAGRIQGPVGFRVCTPEQSAATGDASSKVTVVRARTNLGFAGGNNVGIRCAGVSRFDYFWFLNNDTVVDVAALAKLVERSESDDGIGMVGSVLLYYDRPRTVQALGGMFDDTKMAAGHIGADIDASAVSAEPESVERQMAYVVGASMLVRRQFIIEVGLMDEDYFLYFEELDWAMRGRGRFRLGFAPGSRVFHKAGASTTKILPRFSLYMLYRNRIRFAARFFPARLHLVRLRVARDFIALVVRGRWRSALVLARALCDTIFLRRLPTKLGGS